MDELGEINEAMLDSVQDYYDGLDEEAQAEMEVQVARFTRDGMFPAISEGRLIFVVPENLPSEN
jgi:hypothetical protein